MSIYIDFTEFPKLDVSKCEPKYFTYDSIKKALDIHYCRVRDSSQRFDKNDSYDFKKLIASPDPPRGLDYKNISM